MNRASTILKQMFSEIAEEGVSITFGEFIARLDEKGYGLLVVASSLVVIIPTPPGFNSLAGIFGPDLGCAAPSRPHSTVDTPFCPQ